MPRFRFGVRLAAALVTLAVLAAGHAALVGAADDLPPYLPRLVSLSPELRREVQAIWARRTLSRTSMGQPAPVPLDLYRAFIDLPEVTAAAGQHLNVGQFRVARTGDDAFDVLDGEGARAHYRVIHREARQRVIMAYVYRKHRLVGDVSGAALTLLTLIPEVTADGRPHVTQRLETTVRIDHRIIALVATVLVPLFPRYADRKIGEIFTIAARVSAWAWEKPDEFCAWVSARPDGPHLREHFAKDVPACAKPHD